MGFFEKSYAGIGLMIFRTNLPNYMLSGKPKLVAQALSANYAENFKSFFHNI